MKQRAVYEFEWKELEEKLKTCVDSKGYLEGGGDYIGFSGYSHDYYGLELIKLIGEIYNIKIKNVVVRTTDDYFDKVWVY